MIYRIKIEGKEYNENYTFETPKEGDILDELRAIVEDMENVENKHYIISVDDLEEFETVYNGFQDLRERYGEHAIFCLEELNLGCDKENKWRQILGVYTEIDF